MNELRDAVFQLALAMQTFGHVLRQHTSPADKVVWEALDQAQAQVDDVMASLARPNGPRATSDGE